LEIKLSGTQCVYSTRMLIYAGFYTADRSEILARAKWIGPVNF